MRVLAALFGLIAFAGLAAEANPVRTPNARTELFLEHEGAVPGERTRLVVRQELREGWHVYWRNSGDTGQPLSVTWTAPEGWRVGDIVFPVPKAKATGPITDYVLDGTPQFLAPVDVPADAAVGETARIVGEAYWLICDDVCVPEEGRLVLDVAVVDGPLVENASRRKETAAAKAAVPTVVDGAAVFSAEPALLMLEIDAAAVGAEPGAAARFFPDVQGLTLTAPEQASSLEGERFAIAMEPDFNYDPETLQEVTGVLAVGEGRDRKGYRISAGPGEIAPANAAGLADAISGGAETAGGEPAATPMSLGLAGWAGVILAALLGGALLNLMPCVFPIVFVKAAGIASAAAKGEAGPVRAHALAYAGGVVASFAALAGVLWALRAGGAEVGWGFQLQSPIATGFLAVVMTLVGLHLAGLADLGAGLQRAGGALAGEAAGLSGAFLTGVLAVALAAPCIGPLIGGAMGLAVANPGLGGVSVFLALGLGLAAPYLLLAVAPGLARKLPKPGAWMDRVKQGLSFPVFAAALWLLWVASVQAGAIAILYVGGAALAGAFALWLVAAAPGAGDGRWIARGLALAAAVAGLGALSLLTPAPAAYAGSAPDGGRLSSVAYSEETLADLREQGRPVFVEFTAAWCVTCQVNKQTVLKRPAVERAFRNAGVAYVVGDWTNRDAAITRALAERGRAGVPLYLYFAPGASEPIILPQILTVDGVVDTVTGAA